MKDSVEEEPNSYRPMDDLETKNVDILRAEIMKSLKSPKVSMKKNQNSKKQSIISVSD